MQIILLSIILLRRFYLLFQQFYLILLFNCLYLNLKPPQCFCLKRYYRSMKQNHSLQVNYSNPQDYLQSSYTSILSKQIRDNAQRKAAAKAYTSFADQQHAIRGFPSSFGREQNKVKKYVTEQLGGESVLRNEEILNKFRLQAMLLRNNKNRAQIMSPMITESMMYAGSELNNFSRGQLPNIVDRRTLIENNKYVLQNPQNKSINTEKYLSVKKKIKEKRYKHKKREINLNGIEKILKDISVKLKRNSQMIKQGLQQFRPKIQLQNNRPLLQSKNQSLLQIKSEKPLKKIISNRRFHTLGNDTPKVFKKQINPFIEYTGNNKAFNTQKTVKQSLILLKLNKLRRRQQSLQGNEQY